MRIARDVQSGPMVEDDAYVFPTSFAQRRIWFVDRLQPGSAFYNISLPMRLPGQLEVEVLRRCFQELVGRHESLRTTFEVINGEPMQVIAPQGTHTLPVVDLRGLPESQREPEAWRLAAADAQRPFDLQRGPLFRTMLLKLGSHDQLLILTTHHIVADGWSITVLLDELRQLYQALCAFQPSPLPELELQYADYAVWQRQALAGESLKRELDYWRTQLQGAPFSLQLPTDAPRPEAESFRGASHSFHLTADLTAELRALGDELDSTLFMVLLSGLSALLARYSGQRDLVIGSPVANRRRSELEGIIGCFVNNLVLRARLHDAPSFRELIRRTREVTLGAYEHQDLPFEMLVEALKPERNLSRNPLFQVMFALQNIMTVKPSGGTSGSASDKAQQPVTGTAKFDLNLAMMEMSDGTVTAAFEYNTDLFKPETVERMAEHLVALLRAGVREPARSILHVPLSSAGERAAALRARSRAETTVPPAQSITERFTASAAAHAAAVAVRVQEHSISYRELAERADALASRLLERGLERGDVVGLCATRSVDMLVAMLAVLRCGAAYMPLDPAFPPERLGFMVQHAGARLSLCHSSVRARLPKACHTLLLEELAREGAAGGLPTRAPHPGDVALVLFGSDPLASPRPILIPHRAVVQLALSQELGPVRAGERVAWQAWPSLEMAALESWSALLAGAQLVCFEREAQLFPNEFGRFLVEQHIDVLFANGPLFNLVARKAPWAFSGLERLLCFGQDLAAECVRDVLLGDPPRDWRQFFGPQELLQVLTARRVDRVGGAADRDRVGEVVEGISAYVLDETLEPVPVNMPGRLYVGGERLPVGYLGRPELTAATLMGNPHAREADARLFDTGARARFLPDGTVHLLGRTDRLLRIDGYPVDPGEVEVVLLAHPAIADAVVGMVAGPAGAPSLEAWLVPAGEELPTPSELRRFVRARLPNHMLPEKIIGLREIPRDHRGEVRWAALPRPDSDRPELGADFVAPRSPTERAVAATWAELFGLERVGIHDNFFHLGGHSLLATQVVSRLADHFGVELPLRRIFEAPTVAGMAALLEREVGAGDGRSLPPVEASSVSEAVPLSFAQQRMWFLDRLQPGNAFYNMPLALRLPGPLNGAALSAALEEIVRRHENLRTTFPDQDGRPFQRIHPPTPTALEVIAVDQLARSEREQKLAELTQLEANTPFDLANGPLMRSKLVRLADDDHALLITLHHIIGDGWSLGVLVHELRVLYDAFSAGRPSPLGELPIQYRDFTLWQRRWLSGPALEEQLAWWRKQLEGAPSDLPLLTDRPRPAGPSYRGGNHAFALPPHVERGLQRLLREEEVTPFMALLLAFKTVLYRFSGQSDIVIGTPIANRRRTELEGLIGFFANTLVLRSHLSGQLTFRQALRRLRELTLEAYANQDLPFELLVEKLQPERTLDRNPLFQIMFLVQDGPTQAGAGSTGAAPESASVGGEQVPAWQLQGRTSRFDLTLAIGARGGTRHGIFEYNADLFDLPTIEGVGRAFVRVLEEATERPDCELDRLPLLSPEARLHLLRAWNPPPGEYPQARPLHTLIEEQVRRSPGAVAVSFESERLTYSELEAQAEQLAATLAARGVGPDRPVGICIDRSLQMVIGLYGILKAGGCYVPLEPSHPDARIVAQLEDASVSVLLTSKNHLSRFTQLKLPVVDVDQASSRSSTGTALRREPVAVDLDQLAYIIFTSGSTGRPKGVAVSHRSIVNRLLWMQEAYGLQADDRVAQKTPFGFDVAVWEFFWPLMFGARLVLARPDGHKDPAYLSRFIGEERITTVHFVPSMLYGFLQAADAQRCQSLRRVICSGEELTADLRDRFFLRFDCELHNLYGPTEAAVDVSFHPCRRDERQSRVPIGKPIVNTALHVLDANMEPVPVGVPGELYIGGIALARGYTGRPELTAERFVPDPFARTGGRLYRTGDRARYLPGGDIEFLGRLDRQVKVRGNRIELAEVEAGLLASPHAEEAAALAMSDPSGRSTLVAYVVPRRDSAPALHRFLVQARTARSLGLEEFELDDGTPVFGLNRGEVEFLDRELFQRGDAALPLRHLPRDAVVMDVGANIGLFSLHVARHLPAARLIAVEPLPKAADACELNARAHGLDLRLERCALSSQSGQMRFTVYPDVTILSGLHADRREEASVLRTFLRAEGHESSDASVDELLQQRLGSEEIEVSTDTVSALIRRHGLERVDLLKVDVEKAELEVLQGIEAEDWSRVRSVVVEVHDVNGRLGQITELLSRQGFECTVRQETMLRGTGLWEVWAVRGQAPQEPPSQAPLRPSEPGRSAVIDGLRKALMQRLPDYMVPSHFVLLDALPRTSSGKLDRGALPEARAAGRPVRSAYQPPRTHVERELAGIWREVLAVAQPGIHDDFFALGGHSLLATQVLARVRRSMDVELSLRQMFEAPTIARLATLIEEHLKSQDGRTSGERAADGARAASTAPSAAERAAPLSFSQERLWFLEQLQPGSPVYNIPAVMRLPGYLDVQSLQRAINAIVARHEVLRCTLQVRNGLPVQVLGESLELPIEQIDLGSLAPEQQNIEVNRLAFRHARQPFSLAHGPLVRVALIRLQPSEHVLLLSMHHIVSDGWSMGVFFRELSALYSAYAAGREASLPPLPLQYTDYARRQRTELEQGRMDASLAYWRRRLQDAPSTLELPSWRKRPAMASWRGAMHTFELPAALAHALRRLSREEGTTLFMTLLAGFKALLWRYTGQGDVVVGSPVANRHQPELEGLIGCFINNVVLRTSLAGDPSGRELLSRVRATTLEALEHQSVPFERIVNEVQPSRDLSRNPLFQVMFVLQNTGDNRSAAGGAVADGGLEVQTGGSRFDLTLYAQEQGERIVCAAEYSVDLFDEATIARMGEHFRALLRGLVLSADARLSRIPLLSAGEQASFEAWDMTSRDYELGTPVHRLIKEQAMLRPDETALVFSGQRLSYGELWARVETLARRLRLRGALNEQVVGVCLHRSIELPIAVVAVLEAGAAYLPLDPEHPPLRLAQLIADAEPILIITQEELRPLVDDRGVPTVDVHEELGRAGDEGQEEPLPAPDPCSLAYVLYTSGSTGGPKGVATEHRALKNRLVWMQERYPLLPGERVLHKTPISFDVSVWELLWPLMAGASMVIARPGAHRDPDSLSELIRAEEVSTAHFVPSLLKAYLTVPVQERGRPLRRVICSGEALSPELKERFEARMDAELHNLYGPTEAAIDVTAWSCREAALGTTIPIGRPIANTRIYILDPAMNRCPIGVSGELHIGGIAIARGYWGRPGLTAERFVPDPFSPEPGARLYRTGDRARVLPDGSIEFLGRLDRQIKIRGVRIEVQEIEDVLERDPSVRQAAVVRREDLPGGEGLAAYVVTRDGARFDAAALKETLRARLPAHMVPASIQAIVAIPLTVSGKLQAAALPRPELRDHEAALTHPRDALESRLASLWRELLGLADVGIHESFFALGGHSLLATQLLARLRDELGLTVPLRLIFEAPSIAELASAIATLQSQAAGPGAAQSSSEGSESGPQLRALPKRERLPLSFPQQRLWFLDRFEPGSSFYNIPSASRLSGPLSIPALQRSLQVLTARHESLRTSFHEEEGDAVQVIHEEVPVELPLVDLSQLPPEDREAECARLVALEMQTPFDLSTPPLLRCRVLRLGEGEHVLLLTIHHIISDGWSMGVLFRELQRAYQSELSGIPAELPPLPVQYGDYAVWQRQYVRGEVEARLLSYWRTALQGAPMFLELPTDRPRPAVQTYHGATLHYTISSAAWSALKRLSLQERATPFMTLLASFSVLLCRYSGQRDIIVGTPIANRTRAELEGLIGFFVNTLALRIDGRGNPSFRELVRRTREVTLGAYAHQDLPFERLVEDLQPDRSLSRNPIFQVMLVLQNTPGQEAVPGVGDADSQTRVTAGTAKFDLTLFAIESAGALRCAFEFNTDLFTTETITRMARQLEAVIVAASTDPERAIAAMNLLSAEDRRLLGELQAASQRPRSTARTVHELFERAARRDPSAVAVRFGEESVSYGALDQRARRLAATLVERGVGPGRCVGICMRPSVDLIVGILATLRAGGCYMAIDPRYPASRLQYMLEDSGATLVLSHEATQGLLPEGGHCQTLAVDRLDDRGPELVAVSHEQLEPQDLAYLLYTSGSTGAPKGVAMTHGALVNLIEWQVATSPGRPRTLQYASLSFDVSFQEILSTLAAGGELVLLDGDHRSDVVRVVETMQRHDVERLFAPPVALAQIAEALADRAEVPRSLREIIVAGEQLQIDGPIARLLERLGPCTLRNQYGPTESHVVTECVVPQPPPSLPPIGRPIPGARIYVLDHRLEPVPPGVPGELYIGGISIARGYWRRAQLTAERFLPDPFSAEPGARMYRTGDQARLLSSGELQFLGRLDEQLKIRGFRIEPGEVEAVLAAHPAVSAVAVSSWKNGSTQAELVAWVCPRKGAALEIAGLRAWALRQLPDHATPTRFVLMERLPLTPSGKVNRRALPAPSSARSGLDREFTPPRSPLEVALAAIWAELIGLDRVGLRDHFFELGGQSLIATRVIARLRRELGVDVPLPSLFQNPVLESFVAAVLERQASALPTGELESLLQDLEALERAQTA